MITRTDITREGNLQKFYYATFSDILYLRFHHHLDDLLKGLFFISKNSINDIKNGSIGIIIAIFCIFVAIVRPYSEINLIMVEEIIPRMRFVPQKMKTHNWIKNGF